MLEEYGTGNTITQKYLQGYHGLVKTLVGSAVYYYQDELGSTSHVADGNGALLEYYKYNLYGKPTYWSAANSQLASSNYNVRDLGDGGARWIVEIGLYDDRNRFMSPDLGRFIQPDPIGFKGDASNLYRYCGNDWANKTDPMGLDASVNPVDKIVMRNSLADSIGITMFQQVAQSVALARAQQQRQTRNAGKAEPVKVTAMPHNLAAKTDQAAINEKYEKAPFGKETDLAGPHFLGFAGTKDMDKQVATVDVQIYNGYGRAMHDKDLFSNENATATFNSNGVYARADNGIIHDKLAAQKPIKSSHGLGDAKQTYIIGWKNQRWNVKPGFSHHHDVYRDRDNSNVWHYQHTISPIWSDSQ